MLETNLQSQCTEYLRKRKIRFVHIRHTKGRINPDTVGVSDLIIFLPKGKTLFIELKRNESEKLKPKQKEFNNYLKSNNHDYYKCWYLKQFINTIEMFL